MITQQFLRLVQQLALMPRPGIPISPPQLLQNLFPCRMTHRFVHSATVTVGSGTTYLFPFLHHPSRVTKLLAQFGLLLSSVFSLPADLGLARLAAQWSLPLYSFCKLAICFPRHCFCWYRFSISGCSSMRS